ncbi:DUF4097 domain-containing protein [candidate division KSB1 bacterium]|nr:DUF4097 domain-containing protein [candidate division KSB1 bacterium]
MYRKKFSVFILTLFLMSISLASASTHTREFRKTIDFPSNGKVHVKTVNGRIDLTSWEKEAIEIFAEIKIKNHSHRQAQELLDKVEIIIDRRDDEIFIEADYPRREYDNSFWDWVFGSDMNPVVDFYIKVPKQTNVNLRSTNGKIFAEAVAGNSELHTTNGGIEAENLKGSLEAYTTNGSITARLIFFGAHDEISLKTTNGGIKLILPSDAQADVRASTVNGSIHTDFPLTIQGKFNKKRVNGEINGGGGVIELSTVNGSISIYE